MTEKYYILQYPSSWGMGSDSDTRLVSDSDIRRLIRIELDKKKELDIKGRKNKDAYLSDSYDDRFTGTWNQEVFCDSHDPEEVVEDVIRKRLTTCSTFAGVNDLVLVPESVPVIRQEQPVKDTIVRVCNQFNCVTDVIIGEGVLKRYLLDLRTIGKLGYLQGGMCYDFLGYDLKRVMTTAFWKDIDDLIRTMERKLRYFKENEPAPNGEKYFDDSIKEDAEPEWYENDRREMIEESERILEKFRAVRPMKDEYLSHLLKVGSGNRYINKAIDQYTRNEKRRKVDHTMMVFDDPFEYHDFGQIWHRHSKERKFYSYSELFQYGDDVEWLTASWINQWPSPEECGEIQPFYAFTPVFAGD